MTRHRLDVPAARPHFGWAREPAALDVVVPLLTGWARDAAGA